MKRGFLFRCVVAALLALTATGLGRLAAAETVSVGTPDTVRDLPDSAAP